MNKETVEVAANKYSPDPLYSNGQWEFGDVIDGFKAGAEWQEQQSANAAVEFGFYLLSNGWSGLINEWYNPHTMQRANNKQLYELWLQTKTQ